MSRQETIRPRTVTRHRPWSLRSTLPLALGLATLALAAYWQALDNGFAYFDDDGYVVDNPVVREGLSGPALEYAWTTFQLGNWIPVTWMSYELDVSLWGARAPALHAVDLGLHVANVLLLFFLVKTCTGRPGLSAILAALWAVHPLHVESVAWIAERKGVLSTFFLLLSLICYERYAARLQPRWYVGMACAFLAGMLAKPMLVTLPLLLLLFDFWPLRRFRTSGDSASEDRYPRLTASRLLREKVPLFATSAVFVGIMFWAQHSQAAVATTAAVPFSLRLANVIESYGWYLIKTFVPVDLGPSYPLILRPIDWGRVGGILTGLACLSALAIGWGRRRPWLAFGCFWFLVALLPVIGIVQLGTAAHADRYTYVPHLGLMALLVWEADAWLAQLPRGRLLGLLAAGVLLLLSFELTSRQVWYWHDPQRLWKHALEIDSNNWMAHFHLGRDALRCNDAGLAMDYFQATIELNPGYTDAYLFLGALHQHRKQWDLAERYYLSALEVDQENPVALMNLGIICRQTDRPTAARDYLNRCLQSNPEVTRAREELDLLDSGGPGGLDR